MVERQHQRVMEQMATVTHDPTISARAAYYNNMNMMHQYGAGARISVDVEYRRGAGVDVGWAMSGRRAGPEVRRLGDQCRDHAQ